MQNLSLFESYSQPFAVDDCVSFNLNNYTNLRFSTFQSLTETKSYIPITGCVLEHVLTTTNLTSCEKLYYLLVDSLALISKNEGYSRCYALPSEDWAYRLGCSRSLVFTMQKSLVKKGYFIINKDFDKIGRNNRNLISPTLPTSVFNHLNEKFPDRVGDHNPYNPLSECKRDYLDRTKLFIKLNYDLLKIITSNEYLNPRGKIMWLNFYTRCYKNYMLTTREDLNVGKYSYNDDSSFSFITSYRELAELYSCNTKHLSKSIRALEELGFIKTQNIYIRKRCDGNDDCKIQERQDQSLWKITLSLPDDCIAELEKVKNRSNLKLKNTKDELVTTGNSIDPKLIEDYLILGGIKFNLNIEQSDVLKSAIIDGNDNGLGGANVNSKGNLNIVPPLPHIPYTESYIDSVMEELDADDVKSIKNKLKKSSKLEDIDLLSNTAKTLPTSSSLKALDNNEENSSGIKSDPHVAKSGLLLNKDFLLKIKDIKSNLGATPKVVFNNFLKRFKGEGCGREFNIHSELIREKLKILPKDKADKARKFAYSLVSKGLANGYAAGLSKHELAKQIIHHAASWKPTKLGNISREKEIDAALSVAWKKIVAGTWQVPLELAKAEILQYEFNAYRRKYQESGVLSHEAKTLESDVNNLLGGWCNLEREIRSSVTLEFDHNERSEEELYRLDDYLLLKDDSQNRKYISGSSQTSTLNIKSKEDLQEFSKEFYLDHQVQNQLLYSLKDFESNEKPSKPDDYDYSFETALPKNYTIGNSTLYSLDLSKLSDAQKHIALRGTDTEIMELTTADDKQYFGKLKAMEVNENGELIITFIQNSQKEFIKNKEIFTGVSHLRKKC